MSWRYTLTATARVLGACGSSQPSAAQTTGLPFTITRLATFSSPWAMAFLPDGSALVTEKGGTIKLWKEGRTPAPVSGVPRVLAGGQGGLLDIALSPRFSQDRTVYLTFSEPQSVGGSSLALARAILNSTATGLGNLQVIWRDPAGGNGGQFGGIIAFAPDGQSLFLTSGERQRFTPAQDMSQPLGKVLRLTLDGRPAAGNPFAGQQGASSVTVTDPPADTEAAKTAPARTFTWPGANLTPSQTWSLGHRNPYGLAFTPDGRLWETEMGPKGGDELNLILPGRNYGWPEASNGQNYNGVAIPSHASKPQFEAPKQYWTPSVSPSSLMVYSGNLFSQWKGNGFIGTLSGQSLIRIVFNGAVATKAEQWNLARRIRFVAQGPEGAIYLLQDDGALARLTPNQRRRR
jgi:glucose/arabinose dehydrogenase